MAKDFKAFNHGTGKIDLTHFSKKVINFAKPIEIHLKEDGSITNEPSFCIVLEKESENRITIGEITLKMINEGLADIGYKLSKTE